MLELLSPAGSMEALKAAVQNGADAVYLGCGTFNARQGAKNFTPQTLAEAVRYCHVRGVAVHLTLNTLVSDRETEDVCALIRHAAICGVDAFIVQDLSVIKLCRQIAPRIPIHGSTQLTVHSLPGVQLCAAWGMTRVVLSRELSWEEIRYICKNSPIEIEIFAHGALCMSYSGQCYLSAAIGGRENQHPLSLKDNCLIGYLQEIEAMGVASIKLEGRMKRPEYVAAVTGVYRQALDKKILTENMLDTLMKAFNRQGFTDGYYAAETGKAMFGIREDTKEDHEWLKAMRQTYEAVENGLVDVTFKAEITAQGSSLTVTDPQGRQCTVTGPRPEAARRLPLSEELFAARIGKTGGTPYNCVGVEATIDDGLTMSAAAINGLRRDALDQLTALRARREMPKVLRPRKKPHHSGFHGRPQLTVQVTGAHQLTPKLLAMKPSALYVPLHILAKDLRLCRDLTRKANIVAALPRICHDRELDQLRFDLRAVREQGVKACLVGNLGLMIPVRELGMAIHGDFGLNIYNSGAASIRYLEL